MPSAFDLIGHNPALLEHWVHRFLAALIDGLVVAAIYLLFVLPVAFLGLAWYVAAFLYGVIWLGYSVLLEALFGAATGSWPGQGTGWPGAAPAPSTWPQHQWDEQGRLVKEVKFCTACGGQLVARGDGKLTCVRCGAVY